VLGSFSSRVAPSGSGRAAENIAYGYDSFPKTLNQWIESSGHRQNLLLHGASRVGIASVKSSTTGRTYWAMVIAGDYEQPRRAGIREIGIKENGIKENGIKEKKTATATAQARSSQGCRIKILSLCI
jgi:hypothetical protein